MADENEVEATQGLAAAFSSILGDVHFWVPVAVLAAGLLLLAWVS